MNDVRIHPVCNLLPELPEPDYSKLRESIRARGLAVPLVFWRPPGATQSEDQLIDGRHRLRACQELGIGWASKLFLGDEQAAMSMAFELNDARRHMDATQRALAGARLTKLFEESAKQRMLAGTKATLPSAESRVPEERPGSAAYKAAITVQSSETSVLRAKRVLEESPPEIVAALEAREISVADAYQVRHADEHTQERALQSVRAGMATTMAEAVAREDSNAGRTKQQPSEKEKSRKLLGAFVRSCDALKVMSRKGPLGCTVKDMLEDLMTIVRSA